MKCDTLIDAVEIIESIKTDEIFAYQFFFGSSTVPGRSIGRLRTRILGQLYKSYHISVDPYVFNTLLYEHLWSDGTWKVLDSFNFRSTFFHWLGTVASHCIMDYLEENGLIRISRARTPGNTRLKLKKLSPEYCRIIIDDMVKIAPLNEFLKAVYVEHLDQTAIQKRFNLDEQMYRLTLRASEKALKLALINNVHSYDDVLVEKRKRMVMVSSEFLTIIGQTNAVDAGSSPLREVFGVRSDAIDFEERLVDFLYEFSNSLPWKDEDKFVWQSRSIRNVKPAKVAQSLPGRTRSWVDTRYSRLQCKFRDEIRKWWNSVNCK